MVMSSTTVSRKRINGYVVDNVSRRRINGYVINNCVEAENKPICRRQLCLGGEETVKSSITILRRRINGYFVDNRVEEENKQLCR
jgi:hypothetical protein